MCFTAFQVYMCFAYKKTGAPGEQTSVLPQAERGFHCFTFYKIHNVQVKASVSIRVQRTQPKVHSDILH